jgi:probable rRNA maturation factor
MISIQSSEDITVESMDEIETLLRRAAQETLQQTGAPQQASLSIVLSSERHLQMLNRQHLGIDAPTDVLSFPAGETDPDTGDPYLGDILISYPRAQAQADAGGHSVREELQLLVVHGALHLLDYDHADEESKSRMWAVQGAVLNAIGCKL